MPRVEDVTDYVVSDSSSGPGERPQRVAKAKAPKTLTPSLQATLDDWNRQSDRSVGYTSKALAYGFGFMPASKHSNMVRLVKGGYLKVCRVNAKPPVGSKAHKGSPYSDNYYLVRAECPGEVSEGTLQGRGSRRKKRSKKRSR